MGQKIPPYALRLGINKYWRSRWFFSKNLPLFLEVDHVIRKVIKDMFPKVGIIEIIIERKSFDHCKVIIKTAKPGLLIGKEGQLLKNLVKRLEKELKPIFTKYKLNPPNIDIDVVEVRNPLSTASYLAELAAIEIEKGFPVRKVLKRIMEKAKQQKDILGIKIKASGRVDGATIKRTESVSWGRLPLSKFIADIDHVHYPVLTKSGYVGLSVWLYKGDKEKNEFDDASA
jgi:small subunit ribosomal protein S3